MTASDERRGPANRSRSGLAPSAGWYKDPAGGPGLRWWDGSGWTRHTQPLPSRQHSRDADSASAPRRMADESVADPYGEHPRARDLPAQNGRPAQNGQSSYNGLPAQNGRSSYNGRGFDPGATPHDSRTFADELDNRPNGQSVATAAGRYAAVPALGGPAPGSGQRQSESDATQAGEVRLALVTLGISAAYAVSLVAIALGYLLDVSALRLTGVLGAVFFGVGAAPLQFAGRTNLATRLAVAGLAGLSTIFVGGTVMVMASGWHPLRAALVIGSIAALTHIVGCVTAVQTVRKSGAFPSLRFNVRSDLSVSLGCTAVGTVLWLTAALKLGHIVPGVLGFLPKISLLWYAGLILLIAAIVLARHKPEIHAMLALLSLVSAFTLTPALAYGTPRSQSAAKHIDLVQQILLIHYLNPRDGIYEAYSGFFSGIAWVCTLAHNPNSVTLAAYWPFIVGLVGLAELRFLFGRFGFSRYRVWVGMTLVVLVNAISADYFSPQSAGFVLALGIFGLALGGVCPGLSDWMRLALLLFAGWGLAVTHELSPYIAAGVLIVLAAVKAVRPWFVPATCLLPALIWLGLNWYVVKGYVNFSSLFSLANYSPPKVIATPGLSRLPIVRESSDALLFGLLVLIALAGIGFIRTRRRRPSWGFLISAGVGLILISFNSYGNEGIFRAALFGIPWLAILALYALPRNPSRWVSAAFGIVSVGLVGTFLVSEFGLDNAGVIRPSDLAALSFYQNHAAPNSDLLSLTYGDIPTSVTFPPHGYNITWSQVITAADLRSGGPDAADTARLARSYMNYAAKISSASVDQLYAIWSPAGAQYSVDYGLETMAEAESWRNQLVKSPYWKLVFSRDGTDLFHEVVPPAGHRR